LFNSDAVSAEGNGCLKGRCSALNLGHPLGALLFRERLFAGSVVLEVGQKKGTIVNTGNLETLVDVVGTMLWLREQFSLLELCTANASTSLQDFFGGWVLQQSVGKVERLDP
jgi:hypothetical protein